MGVKDSQAAGMNLKTEGAMLIVALFGDWHLLGDRPQPGAVSRALEADPSIGSVAFETSALGAWDSSLLIVVKRCVDLARAKDLKWEASGLPEGVRDLIDLSLAVPEQTPDPEEGKPDIFTRVGAGGLAIYAGAFNYLDFLGNLARELFGFGRGKVRLRMQDFWSLLQSTGPQALPIVSLLSFLTGLIIAFIGVIQLQKFAADIYVADLVGLAITRELGSVMTGVIMAGRTGAAFAAQIGSMRVNQEIDALTSFGISPVPFLVVPRVLTLVLVMPLLAAWANLVAIVGGLVVAVFVADVSFLQYLNQVEQAVGMSDLLVGIFKSAVFGLIIALSGCYRGLQCGKDAAAVGRAATSAVVTAITWIVVVDAIFAVIFTILDI